MRVRVVGAVHLTGNEMVCKVRLQGRGRHLVVMRRIAPSQTRTGMTRFAIRCATGNTQVAVEICVLAPREEGERVFTRKLRFSLS